MKVTNVIRTQIHIHDGSHTIYAEFIRINSNGTCTYRLTQRESSQELFYPACEERIVMVDEVLDESNLLEAWRLSDKWLNK